MGKRFERKHPDSLWQMDIYEFRIKGVGKVRIFNIEDDHSRYVCASKVFKRKTAQNAVKTLEAALSNDRKPREMYVDRDDSSHQMRSTRYARETKSN